MVKKGRGSKDRFDRLADAVLLISIVVVIVLTILTFCMTDILTLF